MSVTRYEARQRYNAHYDAFGLGTRADRFVTALLYLNDVSPSSGGQTVFSNLPAQHLSAESKSLLGIEDDAAALHVVPRKGAMLVFHNVKMQAGTWVIDRGSRHAALPLRLPSHEDASVLGSIANGSGQPAHEKWVAVRMKLANCEY
eukprot:SAG31_NODE_1561_length_7872_cov_2.787469_6_plen_147_part_00